MVHWFKLSGLIVGASILSACLAGGGAELADEEVALDDTQGLIGEARIIFNDSNNSCMTRPTTANSAQIELTACTAAGNQQWIARPRANGFFEIVANGTEKCIGIEGSSKLNGAFAIQEACDSTNDQLFRIDTATLTHTRLTNANSGKCLEIEQSASGSARITQEQCVDNVAQRWTQP